METVTYTCLYSACSVATDLRATSNGKIVASCFLRLVVSVFILTLLYTPHIKYTSAISERRLLLLLFGHLACLIILDILPIEGMWGNFEKPVLGVMITNIINYAQTLENSD
jgi:hypothetical protein